LGTRANWLDTSDTFPFGVKLTTFVFFVSPIQGSVPGGSRPPSSSTSVISVMPRDELTPEDLDDEELAEYAEECAQRKALEDFEGISEDDLFSWSDIEELDDHRPPSNIGNADEAMDMT